VRENREGGLGGKGGRVGGQGQNALLPPLLAFKTEAVRGGSLGRWHSAGPPGTAANGESGKRERVTRGFISHPHLGLGCAAEVDRWAAADCRLGRLGWRRGGVQGGKGRWLAAVRGEAASSRPPFIDTGRRWKGRNSSTRSLCGQQWRFEEQSHH
jgi:hypothetical protein